MSAFISRQLNEITDYFKGWVVSELRQVSVEERASLRGDYLFIIDGEPSFICIIEPENSWAMSIDAKNKKILDSQELSFSFSEEEYEVVTNGGARVTVRTDKYTLRKLLHGALKSRVAFLKGLVKIEGDLPAFMRLTEMLKKRGVKPAENAPSSSDFATATGKIQEVEC